MDTLTVHTLAEVLKEPNKELLGRVLRRLGQERCSQVLTDALALEASGGMLTKDGTRRRTPGGTFFQLVRDRCTGRERHRIFASQATPGQAPWPQSQAQAPSPAPVDLTLDLWKGLRPMPVTATLKLVLRDMPETRERGGMVYMALHNEPKGLPKEITLDVGHCTSRRL